MEGLTERQTEEPVPQPLLERLRNLLAILEGSELDKDAEKALLRARIAILEADGTALIRRLVNKSGKDSGAVLVLTRFGLSWRLPDGSWLPDKVSRIRRHGLKPVLLRTPVWAKLTRGEVEIYPVSVNYLSPFIQAA